MMPENKKIDPKGCGILFVVCLVLYIIISISDCYENNHSKSSYTINIDDITASTPHWRIRDLENHIYSRYQEDHIYNANLEYKGRIVLLSGRIERVLHREDVFEIDFETLWLGGSMYCTAVVQFNAPIANVSKGGWYTFAGRWQDIRTERKSMVFRPFQGMSTYTLVLIVNNAIQVETRY